MRTSTVATVVALVLGAMPATVQAAPFAGPSQSSIVARTSVEPAAAQRCWWRGGKRHCRAYAYAPAGSVQRDAPRDLDADVGSRRPEEFAFGSKQWWKAMERQGRDGTPQ
jgi:hypothetical protein